jgi:hypothetical protein
MEPCLADRPDRRVRTPKVGTRFGFSGDHRLSRADQPLMPDIEQAAAMAVHRRDYAVIYTARGERPAGQGVLRRGHVADIQSRQAANTRKAAGRQGSTRVTSVRAVEIICCSRLCDAQCCLVDHFVDTR